MTKWIISIGTGKSQRQLISQAKHMGFKIIGIDRDPDINLVDDNLKISTYSQQGIIKELGDTILNREIAGVISRTSGPATLTAAKVSEFLKLPTATSIFAQSVLSKSHLAKTAIRKNIETLKIVNIGQELVWDEGLDLVIKPDQPILGKQNVYRVKSLSQYRDASKKAMNESFNKKCICQKFVAGREIGVMIAVSRGRFLWHFIFEEIVEELVGGKFQGIGVKGPASRLKPYVKKSLLSSCLKFIENLKATGFLFFSFKVTEQNNIFLYEVNQGLSGDGIVDFLIPKIWPKVNFFELDVLLSIGEKPEFPRTGLFNQKVHSYLINQPKKVSVTLC